MSASNDVLNSEANTSEAPTASVPAHRIYRAGTGVRQKLDALGAAIIHRPPFCNGTLSVDAEELVLFYGRPVKDEKTVAG